MGGKLTKAQRRVLTFVEEQGTVVLWPVAVAPTNALMRRLADRGWIARVSTGSIWQGWSLTEAGRSALSNPERSTSYPKVEEP